MWGHEKRGGSHLHQFWAIVHPLRMPAGSPRLCPEHQPTYHIYMTVGDKKLIKNVLFSVYLNFRQLSTDCLV
jgi:hypothetical protein